MAFRARHPSGCDCPAPVEDLDGNIVMMSTCPCCLGWERVRRMSQLELPLEEGVTLDMRGGDSDEIIQVPPIVLVDDGLPF